MSDQEKAPDNFEEAFFNEYPNPKRIGCPGDEILEGLAARKLPISHPARMHIGHCSPCWREFRSFEAKIRRTRNRTLFSGIAALLLVLLLGPYLYRSVNHHASERTIALDLRSINPTRGSRQDRPKLHLPASVVRLVVTLPWGSDGGTYEIQLRTLTDLLVLKTRGSAKIMDGYTTLVIDRIDLSNASQGNYVLSLANRENRLRTDVIVP